MMVDRDKLVGDCGICTLDDADAGRLKALLQISEESAQIREERISTRATECKTKTICKLWRQAGRVFAALSLVWKCDCPAAHATRLLLEHRTGTANDFHLLVHNDAKDFREARRIRISESVAEDDGFAGFKLGLRTRGKAATEIISSSNLDPSDLIRSNTPMRSAMKGTPAALSAAGLR